MAVAKVMADAKVTSILRDLDTEIEERYYSIRTNEKLGLTVNPYPRNREDIEDYNGEMEEEFEESLDDHERLSILEDQENSCQSHNRARLVNSYVHHFVIPEDLGSVDGFAEGCSSPTHDTYAALEKGTGQGNNSGSVNGVVEECNSLTCDFITAMDGDSLKHEEINQSRNLNNSGTGTTVWNLESIIGENIVIRMSGSLLEHEKVNFSASLVDFVEENGDPEKNCDDP